MADRQDEIEILSWFGIELSEDEPWVVWEEYPERDQLMAHLLEKNRGISFDHKALLPWILPSIEKHLKDYGIDTDIAVLKEKHGDSPYLYEWLGGVDQFLTDLGMVFTYFGMLDDYLVVGFFPASDDIDWEENRLFKKLQRETKRFLNPKNWTTYTVEDA